MLTRVWSYNQATSMNLFGEAATMDLLNGGTAQIFDANTGLYDSTNPTVDLPGLFAAPPNNWPAPDRYACIAMVGVPRDAASLAAD